MKDNNLDINFNLSLNYISTKPFYFLCKTKIYDTELEKISDFSSFTDLLHTFDLYRGKREEMADELSDLKRIVGTFKGAFKIYRHPLPGNVEQPDPQYGMFKV